MKKLSIISIVISTVLLFQGCGDFFVDTERISGQEVVILEDVETLEELVPSQLDEDTINIEEVLEPKVYELDIKMVGDNLIHQKIFSTGLQEDGSYDFPDLYSHMDSVIKKADIAIVNQETIFVDDDEASTYPRFGTPTAIGDALVAAGFDIVAHATNHTADKGVDAIQTTLDFWDSYEDITVLGIHESPEESDVAYLEQNNIKLAFVNYTFSLNQLDANITGYEYMVDMLADTDIADTMLEAEEQAELTIAILHLGTEYVFEPTDYTCQQVDKFIDLGADIVLCTHPHVIQPYGIHTTENGNTALVYYSLGNFCSGQDQIPRLLGGMAEFTIQKTVELDGTIHYDLPYYSMTPIVMHYADDEMAPYLLAAYTEELASKHWVQEEYPFTKSELFTLYQNILEGNTELLADYAAIWD
ncbi:MAG: CapA family protein [Lachnospiraceae bacterium]